MPRQQHQRAGGLKVIIRPDTGTLQITGTIAGQRIRQSAQSSDLRLAQEEARLLEAELLRTDWHGERRGAHTFGEAAEGYLNAVTRSPNQQARVARLLTALGDIGLDKITRKTAVELRASMLREGAGDRTYVAEVITPLRAILNFAATDGWCEVPKFTMPKLKEGRTLYLLPGQVSRLIAAATAHLQPLLTFLVGTGARGSEAYYLDWCDVDLNGARAIFWADQTKMGKRRDVDLPPVVVAALANLPHREGRVFRWQDRAGAWHDYADHERRYGGQIKKAWRGALKRAGLALTFHVHDLRHTWASWRYALHHDLLRLQREGGWSSVGQVTRYAHLLPAGHEAAIGAWTSQDGYTQGSAENWHANGTQLGRQPLSA